MITNYINIKTEYIENVLTVKDVKNFNLHDILESGQCFRWVRNKDSSYTGMAYGKAINITQKENDLIFKGCNQDDFKNTWYRYFDFETDYSSIIEKLEALDSNMKEAIKFAPGLRVLNQEPWELLISYIVSANNNIPRIKKCINTLCERYGEPIEFMGETLYNFPTPKALVEAGEENIFLCRVGYRAKYIYMTAKRYIENKDIFNYRGEELKKELIKFHGVGPKVADCVMLYTGLSKEAFPIDVWVKRIMTQLYEDKLKKEKNIDLFARKYFGEYAGIAQLYLFYYARNA